MFRSRKTKRHRSTRRPLGMETLEKRELMAADVPNVAILDFDSEYLFRSDMEAYYASDFGKGLWVSNFKNVFNNTRAYLDLDGNGTVNGADAEEAIDRIVDKVREDFAPYNLKIIVGDQDTYRHVMTDDRPGDVTVMISGGTDNVEREGSAGWAPVDEGNDNDNYAFVFGGTIAATNNTIDRFINNVARTISHEMGHTFGLEHVRATSGDDASQHFLMNSGSWRDFGNDFNFQDITYTTVEGTRQNSHKILSDPNVLGPSNSAWAAVLKPGELTIHTGEEYGVAFWVQPSSSRAGEWDVINWARWTGHQLDPSGSPHINSLNPFDTPITRIEMEGGDFDDHLEVFPGIDVSVVAFGRGGNDTIYGGDVTDVLYGGEGDDRLFGRGGKDYLFGNEDSDYLDGGSDGITDYLWGGSGRDTFVNNLRWTQMVDSWIGFWGREDYHVDYNSREDSLFRKYPWG